MINIKREHVSRMLSFINSAGSCFMYYHVPIMNEKLGIILYNDILDDFNL